MYLTTDNLNQITDVITFYLINRPQSMDRLKVTAVFERDLRNLLTSIQTELHKQKEEL